MATPGDTAHDPARWFALAQVALNGLRQTYVNDFPDLPYTRRWDGSGVICDGRSIRYALISLLGLAKASALLGPQEDLATKLWARVADPCHAARLTIGDLGLGLWARTLHSVGGADFTATRALAAFRRHPAACDSVELAWLLLGAEHALEHEVDTDDAARLGETASAALLRLYNPDTRLFYRHGRSGLARQVTRRVACFANQIYPVMACAVYARRTGDEGVAAIAAAVADNLCRMQGPLGQWWWLYDAQSGQVVDGYPVFSVHQHGMAPMALLETARTTGRDYTPSIARGLRWLSGANELGRDMARPEESMIWRDIHRRGVGRLRRAVAATLWCCGRRTAAQKPAATHDFEFNPECRPYELGWLLYAAGLAAQAAAPART